MKSFAASLILSLGVAAWVVTFLILAIALVLTITGWQSLDGPIIWERVLIISMCPGFMGALLTITGYQMLRQSNGSG